MAKNENFKKFLQISNNKKKILLKALGYEVNEKGFVTDEEGAVVRCKYSHRGVHIKEASILPGSTIVINTTPVTLAAYIEEYLE